MPSTMARKYSEVIRVAVEDLAAGADIAARAFTRLVSAGRVISAWVTYRAASAGIGANPNDATITLRNITKGVDIATVNLTANVALNGTTQLVVTSANAVFSEGDVLGLVVTQNGTADLPAFDLTADCSYQQT